ncbi:hypothetical protein DCC79_12650 [bacterium]|nr:MAG: hypothetical protein DCC79_12650 [bacterium]
MPAPERLEALACGHACRAFPALRGVRPTVQRTGPHHVFTFRGPAGTPSVVRVKLDADGTLVRVVASRG